MSDLSWTVVSAWPMLAVLQWLPLLGAVGVLLLGERALALAVGRVVALLELGVAVIAYRQIDATNPAQQLAERLPALAYHVGADGITALFVLLGALIVVLVAFYELVRELDRPARLLGLVLLIEAMLMVQLVTLNLLWFIVASMVELTLVTLLIGQWSTSTPENRQLATVRFAQFQAIGLMMLIGGVAILAWGHADVTGQWSFDLYDLSRVPAHGRFQSVAFFLLFYGLAVRTPLFPLHGWLPNVMHRGTVSIAPALLLGVKVGIYGMLRFVLPLTQEAVMIWQYWIVGFAMVGVFYAAVLAMLQTNLRRLLSFAVVSHTSLIVIGVFTLHPLGIAGAVLLAVNFGLAATVMLFMVGFVFRRTHTTDLARLGGLFERIPFIAGSFLVGGLAIVGMPGTPGFDAVHLVLEAAMERFGAFLTVATALGNVTAAGFLLWAFQKAFIAPRSASESTQVLERTQPMEYFVGGLALVILLLAGFYFETWLVLTETAARGMALRFGGT